MADLFGDDDSQNKTDFEKMLNQSLGGASQRRFGKGDTVTATVVSIGKDDVFVLVDGQEAVCPKQELLDDSGQVKVTVGEEVKLYVLMTRESLVYLTAKPSSRALSDTLEDAFDMETAVEGRVTEVVNGGFRVQVMGKLGFCPLSQIDRHPVTDAQIFVGKKFDFLITKFEGGGRNIVLSRRKLMDQEKAAQEGAFMQEFKPGDVLVGRVRRLEPFGAFVEVRPGIEGLVHISEISWSRLSHPNEVLKSGDEVNTKILKIEEDTNGKLKISLSMKQAGEDPYLEAVRNVKSGDSFTGKIKSKERFGWLVEIQPGLVGLLPKGALRESVDEKEFEQKNVGDTVRVIVQSVNSQDRKISLSLPREQEEVSWSDVKPTSGFGSLGAAFQQAMNKKK